MADSPTTRTLKYYRDLGWTIENVERFMSIPATKGHPGRKWRKDLFGFIDLVGMHEDHGFVGIQATAGRNISARLAKIKSKCLANALKWVRCGGLIDVIDWRQYKKRVDGKLWRPTIVRLTESDLVRND